MPPPPKPCFGTAGLSADKIAEIDPDYLYFLQHVRLDGSAYTVEIPSKDGGSPPEVIKYEEPVAGPNAEPPVAGPQCGGKGSPSPMEEEKSGAGEVPSGGASAPAFVKPPVVSRDGEARSGAVPMEEDNVAELAAEPAWYDTDPNIDEDYRLFLRHACAVNDAETVFEMGGFSMTLGDDRESEEDEEEEEEDEEEEEEEDEEDDEEEEDEEEEEEEDGDDDLETEDDDKEMVKKESEAVEEDIPPSGEGGVGMDDENGEEEEEVGSDDPMANVSDFKELAQKVKVEEEAFAVDGGVWKGKEKYEKENEEGEVGAAPDWQLVNIFEFEGQSQKVKEVVEEKPLK